MADFAALGGTSETLRTLLTDRMELPPTLSRANFRITVATPTQPEDEGETAAEDARINLFLYRVTENGYLKNQDFSGRGHPGAYGRPPLSLDLHYLIIPYGSSLEDVYHSEVRAQQLLGSAMRVLHDHPVITDSLVTVNDPVGSPILDPSLRNEFEAVKLYLDPLNLEDLSKVWTALTLRYRLSVAYVVSVVQIESLASRPVPRLVDEPPAGGPRVGVTTFTRPHISSLRVRRAPDAPGTDRAAPYARVGDTVVVAGSNLGGDAIVWLADLPIAAQPRGTDALEIVVPDDALPDGTQIPTLRRVSPGPQPLRVEIRVNDRTVPGFSSNTVILMVVPRVDSIVSQVDETDRSLSIAGSLLFDDRLEGETFIGDARIRKGDYLSGAQDEILLRLTDSLPDDLCSVLVSGDLSSFPDLPAAPELRIAIGSDGPLNVTLARKPTNLSEAAVLLQAAIRRAANGRALFQGARVGSIGDRLVLVPAGLRAAIAIHSGETANALRLTPPQGATARTAYLSGPLSFPTSWRGTPAVTATFGGVSRVIVLSHPLDDLDDVSQALESALRGAGAQPAFAGARVGLVGAQLLVLGGTDDALAFDATADDDTTVALLQLKAAYPVRVRVNGLENIERRQVVLPR